MKHNTDYKFSDQIKNVRDFFNALENDYSIGVIEKTEPRRRIRQLPINYLLGR